MGYPTHFGTCAMQCLLVHLSIFPNLKISQLHHLSHSISISSCLSLITITILPCGRWRLPSPWSFATGRAWKLPGNSNGIEVQPKNPYSGYINPYYWVDDHPLLYGNNGSLDPGTFGGRSFNHSALPTSYVVVKGSGCPNCEAFWPQLL